MSEKMYDTAINYFQNKVDTEKLKLEDFKSLFVPIKSAVTERSKRNMNKLKSNPLGLNSINDNILKSNKNTNYYSTINSNKSKGNLSSRIIVNKDGTFKRIANYDKKIDNVNTLKLRNDALMSILNGEQYYPPEFQLKPKFIEKTESIKQESLNDEINNVDLPLKDAPSYTIESNQLTFKVCDEEN